MHSGLAENRCPRDARGHLGDTWHNRPGMASAHVHLWDEGSETGLVRVWASRANNGGTETINGIIELHRRLARGFRNGENYRLRIFLAAGGLTP